MRLRHIEVFNAIMLTGSVSGAARLINITQPAVSRTLQHAEIQLGFALFQRAKGRLTATTEALALYPHIERLFAQLDEVQRLAANLRTASDAGELRILSVLALSYEVLPRALKRFRAQHPSITVTLASLHSPQIMSALLLQEADVGFAFSPAVHPSLTQETLADSRMVCIAPKGMLPRALLRNGSVALHDLVKLPVIGLDSRDPVGTSLSQACRQAGVGFQQAVVTVQTYHAALAMAHHGLGVALVDGCTASSADRAKVDVLTLEPHIPVPIRALRFAGRPDSVAVRSITRCMREAIEEMKGERMTPERLTALFRSGDAMRSRSVSDVVLWGRLDLPAPPARLVADWEREVATRLDLAPGDVESLPLARARARWPDYRRCVQAMADWTRSLGLAEVLAASELALMACRGARYHHDGEQYGGAAFCNLFVSEDKGLDLHFPTADLRIPLARGTAVVFDTGQPHAVIRRQGGGFDPADFAPERDCTQVFLSWELPIEDVHVGRALRVAFDTDPAAALEIDEEQVRLKGERAVVCPESGRWRRPG